MGAGWTNPTQEILLCHYDVKPYRDAFHARNRPCYLLCSSFTILFILTILSAVMYNSSNNEQHIDTFINELITVLNINRTVILKDTKSIYPSDLVLSISPNAITANKEFPICFPAPTFLMPLLRTPSPKEPTDNEAISSIDDIKKAHHDIEDDILKAHSQDWLKVPSLFGNNDDDVYAEDESLLNIRIEELWESILGYTLDPNCFIRIDPSSTKIFKHLESADVQVSNYHDYICANEGSRWSIMKPSFIVINPDNAIIYQLNIVGFYYGTNQCYWFENTMSYNIMDQYRFHKLLSEDRDEIKNFFNDMNGYLTYVLIALFGVVCIVYFGWMAYLCLSMLLEGFIATLVVWMIMSLLKCLGALSEFGDIAPTFKEIWRINLLLCIPDFSFVRVMQLTSVMIHWRICARIVSTLLLLIDIYQHDPPQEKES